MAKTADEILSEDITSRLNCIALHFERREELCIGLKTYKICEYEQNAARSKEIQGLAEKIQTTEASILHELAHLMDNVKKYYNRNNLPEYELSVVKNFKPFRIAANFANVKKHCSRGRGKSNARIDFYALVEKSSKHGVSKDDAQLVDIQSIINIDGATHEVMDIADSLVRLWELFLRNHTDIDLSNFIRRIQKVMPPGLRRFSIGRSQLLKGPAEHAKELDQERKYLNL